MSDPVWLAIAKTVLSPVLKLVGLGYESFRRPSIKYKRAPENIFEHVKPGVSVARMREILGTPHKEEGGQYRYRFSDACVQVDSEDKITLDSIAVGLSRPGWRNHFHVWPMHNLVLGKSSFKELVEEDEIRTDSSSKHYHFYVVKYYGFPGLYWTYALGFLECPGVMPGNLTWFPGQHSKSEIPPDLTINWACVSRIQEPPTFNYYGFL